MRRLDYVKLLKEARSMLDPQKDDSLKNICNKIDDALKEDVKMTCLLYERKTNWAYIITDGPISYGTRKTEEETTKHAEELKKKIQGFWE